VQTDDNSAFSSGRRDLHGHSSGILTVGYKTPVITLPMKLERYIRLTTPSPVPRRPLAK
jgi:hypothetical protein